MGIPGMLTFLRDRGTIKKRELYHHSWRAGQGTDSDQPVGLGLIFDSRSLAEILLQEWANLHGSHPLRFDPARGGWVTQLRAFSGYYLKQLVEEYQCTIAWVRDAGVNDKPAMIPQSIYEFLHSACPRTDHAIQSGQNALGRTCTTANIISDFHSVEAKNDDFLLDVAEDVHQVLGSALFAVINAPANGADAEVWRQARRMAARRKTFIVSGDTDMFFFTDISCSNIGVVLLHGPAKTHRTTNTEAVGEQWSCDLGGNVSSRCLRLKYCFVEDVANEFKVDVKYLPVLGACLGGDLGKHDGNYHDFTVRLKAALLERHFKDPAVLAAFREPEEGLRQELRAVRKARTQGHLSSDSCIEGEFCSRASCEQVHPMKGNLRCQYEKRRGGRCLNPSCRKRHSRPIGFRIAAGTLHSFFNGRESLKFTTFRKWEGAVRAESNITFRTWEGAVRAVSNIANEWKMVSYGIGPYIAPGVSLFSFKDHRRTILRLTCELLSTRCKSWGEIDGKVYRNGCARDLCSWLNINSSCERKRMSQALIRAIKNYSHLPLDQPLASVKLEAPTRTLETWRMRKFYWISPYPLPSDAGNLNWITEHLRQNIGRELGITDYVEAIQIGSKYVIKRVVCGKGFEARSGRSPSIHGTRSRPPSTLFEALGLKRGPDDEWLQDLETILQALPGLLCSETGRKNGSDFRPSDDSYRILERRAENDLFAPANSAIENLDSVGVLNMVILSITLWQRTLSSSQAQEPDPNCEKVEPLAMWEMRAFIGSVILGWIQLQRKECPFDLLADKVGPSREDGMDFLFLYIPVYLRRRVFVLTAQFLEVVNDVKNMTTFFICPRQEHLLHGLREVCFNPEAIFSLYTAVGHAKSENERDRRVRSNLDEILYSGDKTSWAQFAEVCDRLVHHVMGTPQPNNRRRQRTFGPVHHVMDSLWNNRRRLTILGTAVVLILSCARLIKSRGGGGG